MHYTKVFSVVMFALLSFGSKSRASSLDDELILTHHQKLTLDMFRLRIEPDLSQDYMKEDIYLVHWLRASNFNLDLAERRLRETQQWRRDNGIDTIDQLDWSEFGQDYPYTTDVYDREGRPTFVFSFGEWDIRKAAVTGQTQKLILYWAKVMEELMSKVRQLQKEGQNVTRCNLIVDIRDYNLVQHSCPQCIPVYTGFISLLRTRYPEDIHRAYLVNAPRLFELLMQILRPVMGETGDSFRIFGPNKKEWQKQLLQDYTTQQLPPEFGGSNRATFDEQNVIL